MVSLGRPRCSSLGHRAGFQCFFPMWTLQRGACLPLVNSVRMKPPQKKQRERQAWQAPTGNPQHRTARRKQRQDLF